MASESQTAANRRNAQKSTGPKTPEGKAASSRNALKHGLTAEQLVIFDERADDFAAYCDDMRTAYAPADAVEDGLVERIAMGSWRLRRVWRAEAAAINEQALTIARHRARAAARDAIAAELRANPPGGKAMTPDEVRRAAHDGAAVLTHDELEEAMTPEGAGGDEESPRGPADAVVWPDKLADFSRYEAPLERALSRATRELERRQARRRVEELAAAEEEKAREAAAARAAAIAESVARRAREAAAPPESDPSYRAMIKYAKRSQFRGAPPPQTERAADPPPR